MLKLIALITMIIDHAGLFFQLGIIPRIIGRVSFPIYAYLIAKGVKNSKNLLKYSQRILILAITSQLIWMFVGIYKLNILFAYFLFILYVHFSKKGQTFNSIATLLITLIISPNIDYGIYGIAVIFLFYYFNNFIKVSSLFILVNFIYVLISQKPSIQFISILALPIIYFLDKPIYDIKSKSIQKLFYYAYPLHLIVMTLIKMFF